MDDRELLEQFRTCTLPYAEWTHRAHVRVAYLYLREHGFEQALPLVRAGIQAYNASQLIPEGPTSGYNETTTHAFLHLVAATMAAYSEVLPTPNSEAFCDAHPQLLTKQILRLYYSPEHRMLPEAKHEFVPPDLAPLPAILHRGEQPTPDDFYSVLRHEFDAAEGSFTLKLRCELEWDQAAFSRLTEAMRLCCQRTTSEERLERWLAEGFWFHSHWVRTWSTHESFPRDHPADYYARAYQRLDDLAFWFFVGQSPYQHGSGFDPL